MYTRERGIHRITAADLAALGVAIGDIEPQRLALTRDNAPVAIRVLGETDGHLDPQDEILFYAEPYTGRYMRENVYRLSWQGAPGLRIAVSQASPAAGARRVNTVQRTIHLESDRVYYSTYVLPATTDHFFDDPLYAFAAAPVAAAARGFTPVAPASVGWVQLTARLHGGAARADRAPDQAVTLRINDVDAGTFTWDGSQVYTATATLPATVLHAGENTVSLAARLDQLPGIGSFWVSPDWVEVRYASAAVAVGDELYVPPATPAGRVTTYVALYLPWLATATGVDARAVLDAAGFSSSPDVYDVTDARRPVQLTAITATEEGGYTARFAYDSSHSYFVATSTVARAPFRIIVDAPSAWRTPAHAADIIAVVHRSLWDAIDPLLEHRMAEGLRVAKVDVQDVYDEFSAGRLDPEAIRAFITYAYHVWNAAGVRPAYVLLVGDGHYDFKGALAPELPVLISPYLLHADPFIGETAADNRYACVDGPLDRVPDLAIGRIPARNASELAAYVDKVLTYERAGAAPATQPRLVFVADAADDPAGDFHALSDQAAAIVPPPYEVRAVYWGASAALDSAEEMRAAIRDSFQAGALVLQWFGHASRQRWGSGLNNVFDLADPPQLPAGVVIPFTVHYSCWSGYFINPRGNPAYGNNEQSLGEALVLAPGRGSLADFSPTGLHVGSAALRLNEEVLRALLVTREARIGQAVMLAKRALDASGTGSPDLIDTQVLFGDPALRLRLAE